MLRKKFYKSILISIVVAIGVLILSAGLAWANYPPNFDNGQKDFRLYEFGRVYFKNMPNVSSVAIYDP